VTDESIRAATPDLSVIVPCYNEGENIATMLRALVANVHVDNFEVLVVYDFAEDTTVPVVDALKDELPQVRLHHNQIGRGALNALRAGFAVARAPYVLVTMADLSDDPADIDGMLDLARNGADVVAASRYMRGGGQFGGPLLKRTMSRLAGLSLHYVGGIGTHDPTSNYKLYSRQLLDRVTIESEAGFELALELTVKAHMSGLRVSELPSTWRDRTAGESRFQIAKWLPHYLRWYFLAMRYRCGLAR
jgi:glycosyltransferase involved in cell wall biosynthesis